MHNHGEVERIPLVAFIGSDLRLIPAALVYVWRGRRIMTGNIVLCLGITVALFLLALFGAGRAGVVQVHEIVEVVVILNGVRAAGIRAAKPRWRRCRKSRPFMGTISTATPTARAASASIARPRIYSGEKCIRKGYDLSLPDYLMIRTGRPSVKEFAEPATAPAAVLLITVVTAALAVAGAMLRSATVISRHRKARLRLGNRQGVRR